jgi:hypothetical protein
VTSQTILGIDPGAHGAIAVMNEGGDLLEVFDMPSTPEANGRTALAGGKTPIRQAEPPSRGCRELQRCYIAACGGGERQREVTPMRGYEGKDPADVTAMFRMAYDAAIRRCDVCERCGKAPVSKALRI